MKERETDGGCKTGFIGRLDKCPAGNSERSLMFVWLSELGQFRALGL